MLLFTIVEPFSPADGKGWESYCGWRGIKFERFDSIDGILRPNLFQVPDDDDWPHIVNESFMLHFITEYAYAQRKLSQIGRGDLVGVRFEEHEPEAEGFLGFDLIDGDCNVSLLTNWGHDIEIVNRYLASNALVPRLDEISEIHAELKREWATDGHVEGSRIVSIYDPRVTYG